MLNLFIFIILILIQIFSFFMLYKKTHSLIHKPNPYSKKAILHYLSLFLIIIGFFITALCGFSLSKCDSTGMGFGISQLFLYTLIGLPIAIFIFILGVWLSKFQLKITVLLSGCMSVPFFLGRIYYGYRADNSDGYYIHSDLEIVAVVYGLLFLIPLIMARNSR